MGGNRGGRLKEGGVGWVGAMRCGASLALVCERLEGKGKDGMQPGIMHWEEIGRASVTREGCPI